MPQLTPHDYLNRIHFRGHVTPTLATLNQLISAHLAAVPFENLDMLLQIPFSLEREDLWDKLVNRRRGGVCHELNHAFFYLLGELGYDVQLGSANVGGGAGEFEHTNLRVRLKGKPYLVDVGFGRQPLPLLDLTDERPQSGFGFRYRVRPEADGTHTLLHFRDGEFRPLQSLYHEKRRPEDFAAPFQRACIPGATPFSTHFICMRTTPAVRYRMVKNQLSTITRRGVERIDIPDADACARVLGEYFGLTLPRGYGPAALGAFL